MGAVAAGGAVLAGGGSEGLGGALMGAGSLASSIMGGGGGTSMADMQKEASQMYFTPDFINTMNTMLQKAQDNAIAQSTTYTNEGVQQQQQSLQNANNALSSYLAQGIQQSQQASQQGFNLSQALQAPYAQAGYNALDAYQDSLGLSRPQMGSAALSANLTQAANQSQAIQALQQQYGTTPPVLGSAPVAPDINADLNNVTAQQIQDAISQDIIKNNPNQAVNTYTYKGPGGTVQLGGNTGPEMSQTYLNSNPAIYNAQKQSLADQVYQQQLTQYNQQQQAYQAQQQLVNNYNSTLQGINFNPQAASIAAAYNQGLFSK